MKKVLIGIGVLLVLLVGGVAYIWSNLDEIVKSAIETFGSEATKTTVSVAEVKLKLEAGEASIAGLKVGNPAGFIDPNIFELGKISTKIDINSLDKNPIVIDEIIISAPAVYYEINKAGSSNADVLKKNLGSGSGSAESSQASSSGGEELKMIIRKLVVEGTSAKVRIAALGGAEQTLKLPRIEMTDVGKKSGGATAAEVAKTLSSRLLDNVKGAVAGAGLNKYIGKSADEFKKQAAEATKKLGGSVGGVGGDAGSAIKGLLGN